jgi:hypothetical protein
MNDEMLATVATTQLGMHRPRTRRDRPRRALVNFGTVDDGLPLVWNITNQRKGWDGTATRCSSAQLED